MPEEDLCFLHRAKLHRNVSATTGARMGIKSSVFEEVGDLDKNLSML